jgi:hypothetical protein
MNDTAAPRERVTLEETQLTTARPNDSAPRFTAIVLIDGERVARVTGRGERTLHYSALDPNDNDTLNDLGALDRVIIALVETHLYTRTLERAQDVIDQHGHAVIAIPADPTSMKHAYAYTIGLDTLAGFELFVAGLPQAIAMRVLNGVAERVKAGFTPSDDHRQHDGFLQDLPVRFLRMTSDAISDHHSVANALDRLPSLAYQLLWPDTRGRFPDDARFEARLKHAQPLYGTTRTVN